MQFLKEDEKLVKSKTQRTVPVRKEYQEGEPERGESENSLDWVHDEPAEIGDGRYASSLDSASVASTLSSGIGDAGFLYKRLKVAKHSIFHCKVCIVLCF